MSLPHALLAALVERPSSGADLARRFDRSLGYFWHATHQQIYRELARMEEAGWVRSLPEEATRGRKRAYRLLAAGRKELKRWLATPKPPVALRDDMMVRLWAEAAIGPTPGLMHVIDAQLAQHEAQLAVYESYAAAADPDPAESAESAESADAPGNADTPAAPDAAAARAAALHALVLGAGMQYERYWIELLRQARALLADEAKPISAPAPAPR